MRYYRYLYLPDGLEKKKAKIKKKLEQKKFQIGVYLIILPQNKGHHLEIIHSAILLQKHYPLEDYFVVGLTQNYEDALEVVEKITQEVYDKTKDADIRSYILQREQEG